MLGKDSFGLLRRENSHYSIQLLQNTNTLVAPLKKKGRLVSYKHCSTSCAPREPCASDESRGVVCSSPRVNTPLTTQIQAWFDSSLPKRLILLCKQCNMRGKSPAVNMKTQHWCLINNCRIWKICSLIITPWLFTLGGGKGCFIWSVFYRITVYRSTYLAFI